MREHPDEALPFAREAHARARLSLSLPAEPPKGSDGIPCSLCANECRIGVGERGYCGLRENKAGRLVSCATPGKGLLYHYLDPQVTNCCSAWFCPAGTGAGFPRYACRPGPELGYENLAVFFYGCNFDCLFCQNASHKSLGSAPSFTAEDLVQVTLRDDRVSCWCFFGGSPEPQLPFALNASRKVLEAKGRRRILRVCFEWNGAGHPKLVKEAAKLSLVSGGNIKFDLKCFSPELSIALSGVPNRRAYENFELVYREFYAERPEMPLLTATTLLVPGYVDAYEVEQVASFIARLSPEIPYSLLLFHPDYLMSDLPHTPMSLAVEAYRAATKHLRRVHVGNLHQIGLRSMKEFEQEAQL
ncbi:MAG: radical SAM protein [Candidatus Bathyarchaeia archaeon]